MGGTAFGGHYSEKGGSTSGNIFFIFSTSQQINWQRQRERWREAAGSKSLCGCDQRRISEPSAAFKSSDGLKAVFDFSRVSFIIKLLWPELDLRTAENC